MGECPIGFKIISNHRKCVLTRFEKLYERPMFYERTRRQVDECVLLRFFEANTVETACSMDTKQAGACRQVFIPLRYQTEHNVTQIITQTSILSMVEDVETIQVADGTCPSFAVFQCSRTCHGFVFVVMTSARFYEICIYYNGRIKMIKKNYVIYIFRPNYIFSQ